jgi:hypothetical protein
VETRTASPILRLLASLELWTADKNGKATMANGNNGNQFRDNEIIILEQLRDGKMVRNIYPKIGGRLRLAHEENDQLSITSEVKSRSQCLSGSLADRT